MAYLIDGFNLLYKFPHLEELMYAQKLTEARTGLLSLLKEFMKITGKPVRVVFDGKKEQSLDIKSEKVSSIDIYYSLDYSADFLIKEFVKKDLNPRMTTVVTSDNGIIFYVNRFRVKVMKSEDFARFVTRTIEESRESVVPEKDDNPVLSEDEVNFWRDLFRKK